MDKHNTTGKKPTLKERLSTANYYASSLAFPFAVVGAIVGLVLQFTGRLSGGPVWLLCAWAGAMVGMIAGYLYGVW